MLLEGEKVRENRFLLCMDEREQIGKASLNKVMLQRTSEISSQNPRRKEGDKKKDKWKVKMDFIWG